MENIELMDFVFCACVALLGLETLNFTMCQIASELVWFGLVWFGLVHVR